MSQSQSGRSVSQPGYPLSARSRTRRRCVRVAPIAQDSPLLPPVGVWAVSQSQSGRSVSQPGYPLSARWAVTPPST